MINRLKIILIIACLLPLTSCDSLLEQEAIDEDLQNPLEEPLPDEPQFDDEGNDEEYPPIDEGYPNPEEEENGVDLEAPAEEEPDEAAEAPVTILRKIKRKRTTTKPMPRSCEEQLADVKAQCYAEIEGDYDDDDCSFIIHDESCAWEFRCEVTVTEAPQAESSEFSSISSSSSESACNSCEVDREIHFENCWIKVNGTVKRTRN